MPQIAEFLVKLPTVEKYEKPTLDPVDVARGLFFYSLSGPSFESSFCQHNP